VCMRVVAEPSHTIYEVCMRVVAEPSHTIYEVCMRVVAEPSHPSRVHLQHSYMLLASPSI